LIKLVTGIWEPDAGIVTVNGSNIYNDTKVRKSIGYVSDQCHYYESFERLDPEMVELLLKNGAKTDTEFTSKESLLSELKNIRDSIEWFDFGNLKNCRLIEKMLKEVK